MIPAGFERATPASEGPQKNALDHVATGISMNHVTRIDQEKKKGLLQTGHQIFF
jgi:hypothetical protein